MDKICNEILIKIFKEVFGKKYVIQNDVFILKKTKIRDVLSMKRTCKRWYNILVSIDDWVKNEIKKNGKNLEIKRVIYLDNEYNSRKWSMKEIYLEGIERLLFGNELRKVMFYVREKKCGKYKGIICYSNVSDNRRIKEEVAKLMFENFQEFVKELIDGKKERLINILLNSKKNWYNKGKVSETILEKLGELENFNKIKFCNFNIYKREKEVWVYIYV